MPKRVIIRPGQVHPLVAATIPNLEIVNTGVTVEDQEKYNKYAQDVQLAQMRLDAAKHGNKPKGEIKEDYSDWARAHTFEQNNPKLAKAVQFIPVANTLFNTMKSGDTRPEKLNVARAAVSDAMALAGLGIATKALGPTTAVVSDIGGTAGAYAGNELGEHLVETGKISPEAGMYAVPGLTLLGGSLGAGTAFKTYRGWQRALQPDVPVIKPEYSNWGGEFMDDVAVNSRQHYLPRQSKLSVDELAGIPKPPTTMGMTLSHDFRHPAVIELIEKYPKYYTPIKTYMSRGMSELDALKQLIIDRNTTFRMFGVGGNSREEAIANMEKVSDMFARQLRKTATNPNLFRVRSNDGVLYTSSYPKQTYGSPQFAYKVGTYPEWHIARRVKLQPDFNFNGDPSTWFDNNPSIPQQGSKFTFNDPNGVKGVYLPEKYRGKFPHEKNIYYGEFPKPYPHHEMVFEAPDKSILPLKVTDYEDFTKYKPSNIFSEYDMHPSFTKFDTPLVTYGYHSGGQIKPNLEDPK